MLWKQACMRSAALSRRFISQVRDNLKFHSHSVITAHSYGTQCEATVHPTHAKKKRQSFIFKMYSRKQSSKWTEVHFHMSICLQCILNGSLHHIPLTALLWWLLLLQYLSPSLEKQHRHWDWWDSPIQAGKWQLCHTPASNDTAFLWSKP